MENGGAASCPIEQMKIEWHATTPRRFVCAQGCMCCCTSTMFLPSETGRLAPEKRQLLRWRNGVLSPVSGEHGICVFFDKDAPLHCTIFERRPLRCRLYPFLPVVERGRIVILADPFVAIGTETNRPGWLRCYGLGQGPDVTDQVEELAREFLTRVLKEQPDFLISYLCVDDAESLILPLEVEKHRHPVVPSWNEELVREEARREQAVAGTSFV